MWTHKLINWTLRSLLALAMVVVFPHNSTEAASKSNLSRWLSREARPELEQLLATHPRYRGQRVQIVAATNNALSDAITTVVSGKLASLDSIKLVSAQRTSQPAQPLPLSIDELDCQLQPGFEYQVQVTAQQVGGQDRVMIEVVDMLGTDAEPVSWNWSGTFNSAERRYLNKPASTHHASGSLAAPWNADSVQSAATALSREFACNLRPHVETRVSLQWPSKPALPALFADTSNASRHLLGTYRELGISDGGGDYRVEVRLEQFMGDIWQLWLTGTPTDAKLAPIQAVTYFKVENLQWPVPVPETRSVAVAPARPPLRAARPIPPANLGEPLDYIRVELLDATQTDSGNSRADLQVTLRIANRAQWPIEYSFSLSGGHFNQCIARPEFYRHDRYGVLRGSVNAGDSVVQRMVIKDARHRPTPWFGQRKCAGFRDLEGFEEFASQGYRVTDFVRWEM
jgi:hypothetical protein